MTAPYREPLCASCGLRPPTRDDVALCAGCLREAVENAHRVVRALDHTRREQPGDPRRRWLRHRARLALAVLAAVTFAVCGFALHRPPAKRNAPRRDDDAPSARAAPPALSLAATMPGQAPMAWPPHVLVTAGPESHDPKELLSRAWRLADAGLDLPIVELTLPRDGRLPFQSIAVEPARHPGAGVIGVALVGWDGSMGGIGLLAGDIVTAVNGFPVTPGRDEWAREFLRSGSEAVVEILRGGRRLVVAMRWR